jgi:hypothetical protein
MELVRNQIFTFSFKIFTLTKEKSRNHHDWGHFTDVGSQKRLGGRFIGLAGDLGLGGRLGPLREISRHLAGGGNAGGFTAA